MVVDPKCRCRGHRMSQMQPRDESRVSHCHPFLFQRLLILSAPLVILNYFLFIFPNTPGRLVRLVCKARPP
ncbi:hypothetical protein ACN38_g3606 [Penicillium nordicum]|uniref:Transmembrane protein n=1 Tax=Penicillium nordicum TaxID=229535 RepID=A0A0N0RZE1_9EURO|nr:hypothetical protein ACN38_g3606 [Penicillium nordicum]